MNDKILDWAMKIKSISQIGLAYAKDPYDKERYQQLEEVATQMLETKLDMNNEKIVKVFCNEEGYRTPKIDTRAAIIKNNKILLVHENNDTWSLPGGWCDEDQSIVSNTLKEIKEETGLDASIIKLVAIQDWRNHNVTNYIYGVMKSFVLCDVNDGNFINNIETSGFKYFAYDELPNNLALEKVTKEQILMCFKAYEDDNWKVIIE